MYTGEYLTQTTNRTRSAAQGTLPSVLWQPGREGDWRRMDTCICMAELLSCSPETLTVLGIRYTPIQKKKKKKRTSSKNYRRADLLQFPGKPRRGVRHWGRKWWSLEECCEFSKRKSFHANLVSCFDELHQNSQLGECPRKCVLLSVKHLKTSHQILCT